MKVILVKDVPNVGRKNEVKDVSDGFARNFLLARNLAKPATENALKALAGQKILEERESSEEYQRYKSLVEKLKSLTLTFKVKIGEKGRAFGSVTAVKVRDALKKQGMEVEKEWILLEDSIKTSGERKVKIKLPHNFTAEIKIIVEKG